MRTHAMYVACNILGHVYIQMHWHYFYPPTHTVGEEAPVERGLLSLATTLSKRYAREAVSACRLLAEHVAFSLGGATRSRRRRLTLTVCTRVRVYVLLV